MKRKIYIALLAMCIMVTMCFTAAPAYAKQADIADYSSAKTLEYAKANTLYDSQDMGDCVKFVRAAVEAGSEYAKLGGSVKKKILDEVGVPNRDVFTELTDLVYLEKKWKPHYEDYLSDD